MWYMCNVRALSRTQNAFCCVRRSGGRAHCNARGAPSPPPAYNYRGRSTYNTTGARYAYTERILHSTIINNTGERVHVRFEVGPIAGACTVHTQQTQTSMHTPVIVVWHGKCPACSADVQRVCMRAEHSRMHRQVCSPRRSDH